MMVFLLAFASVSQLASFFLTNWNKIWTFYNAYTLIDSLFWGCLFFRNSKSKTIKYIIITALFLQVFVSIYVFSFIGINKRFFSEFVCLNSLLESLWVLSFFYERYKRDEIEALEREPMFWFCLGILIYGPSTYFLFAFYEVIRGSQDTAYEPLWTIHDCLNICMYFIFSIGIAGNVARSSKFRNAFIRYGS